jgi:hypothetical protein
MGGPTSQINWKDQPWKCTNCQFLLGVVSEDGLELRIKWRDLLVTIGDAKYVKEVCRRCGKLNELYGGSPLDVCVQS